MSLPPAAPGQCVILVGGLGARLGDRLGALPKPLVPVGGQPFLNYLLWHVRRFGFQRVLLLAGHRSAAMADFVAGQAQGSDIQIDLVVEPAPMGTGGALRYALPRLEPRFCLLNGDSLFDFNWLDLVALAVRQPRAQVVMALRQQADAARFGVVEMAGEQVSGFRARGDAGGGAINGGVYLLDRSVAEAAPERGSFEAEVLPALAADGRVAGRIQSGFFLDIGVPDALDAAQTLVPASLRRPAVGFDLAGGDVDDPGWTLRAAWAVKAANDAHRFAFLADGVAPPDRLQSALRARGAHLDDLDLCAAYVEGDVETRAI